MNRWHRVFGISDIEPAATELVEHLRSLAGEDSTVRFPRDEHGWYAADVLIPQGQRPWRGLNRYCAGQDDIRHELNSWAAWLETFESNQHRDGLMSHLINTRQIFTFELEIGDLDPIAELNEWSHGLCKLLAGATAGVYQIDGQGFFAADGTLLVRE
jgi:hypothetical protein